MTTSLTAVREVLAAGDLRRALELTTEEACRACAGRAACAAWLARAEVLLEIGAYPEARHSALAARKLALENEWRPEAAQAYLALARCGIGASEFARSGVWLDKAPELLDGSAADLGACAAIRADLLWEQRRLEDLRALLGPGGGPPTLARLRLEVEEERWDAAAATWEEMPAGGRPYTQLERLLAGAHIAQARGAAERATWLQQEAERLANQWVDSLPGSWRGRFASHLRLLGLEVRTESSVTPTACDRLPARLEGGDLPVETRTLAEVLRRMSSENRLEPLLNLILDSALGLCGGEYGYLVVLEAERVECRVARHEGQRTPSPAELSYSRRIAEEVARRTEPFLSVDVQHDPRANEYESVLAAGSRSILCVPMRIQERPLGSLYLHSVTRTAAFGSREVEIARILADQAALAIERSRLLARSQRDSLTSLYNHTCFEQLLAQQVEACRRHDRVVSLLLVDLDEFKPLNDTYGHDFGTRVLREISQVLETSLRASDAAGRIEKEEPEGIVGRYGGDEFEVLLPDTPRADAVQTAQRLLTLVRERSFRIAGKEVSVGMSVGVATFPQDAPDAYELFLRADEALYDAKHAGRGCVMGYRDRKEAPTKAEPTEVEELLRDPSGRRLLAVLPQVLAEGPELTRTLPRALELVRRAVRAERGFLFARSGGAAPTLLAVSPAGTPGDPARFSATVLAEALRSARPVVLRNLQDDQAYAGAESVQRLGVRSALCVPVPVEDDYTVVLYLESGVGAREFKNSDLPLLESFAKQLAAPLRVGRVVDRQTTAIKRLSAALEQEMKELQRRHERHGMIGRSDAIRRVFEQIDRFAAFPYPVLVTGETGTGKELTARAIHFASGRRAQPFLAVNCGAVPRELLESELFGHVKGAFTGADRERVGLFEAAHGGTLFLDEVEAMADAMQVGLLRILQEGEVRPVGAREARKVDVRVIAATNQDLERLVKEGKFRSDLLFRLKVFNLTLPPLRERREDIPVLVEHVLGRIAEETKLPRRTASPAALRALGLAPWPGNVRELENVLKQAVAFGGEVIEPRDLPAGLVPGAPTGTEAAATAGPAAGAPGGASGAVGGAGEAPRRPIDELWRSLIRQTLEAHAWNVSRAAEELGISRTTLYKRMKEYGIEPPQH